MWFLKLIIYMQGMKLWPLGETQLLTPWSCKWFVDIFLQKYIWTNHTRVRQPNSSLPLTWLGSESTESYLPWPKETTTKLSWTGADRGESPIWPYPLQSLLWRDPLSFSYAGLKMMFNEVEVEWSLEAKVILMLTMNLSPIEDQI